MCAWPVGHSMSSGRKRTQCNHHHDTVEHGACRHHAGCAPTARSATTLGRWHPGPSARVPGLEQARGKRRGAPKSTQSCVAWAAHAAAR
eukprot:7385822-Pyramimonas_sp.AAC.1